MGVSNTIRGKSAGPQPDPDKWFKESTMAGHKLASYDRGMDITDGPFSTHIPDDPVADTRFRVKQAGTAGAGNPDMNSPAGPGRDSQIQNSNGPFGGTGPVYGLDMDDQSPEVGDKMKVDSAPAKGVKKSIRMALAGRDKSVKDKHPLPEVLPPASLPRPQKPSNIDSDDHNRSAWTQSGPGGGAMMHSGQMKLGFIPDEEGDTDPGTDPEADTESDEAPEPAEMSPEYAEARLAFASVPLSLVSDPMGLFPPRIMDKMAADSSAYLDRDDAHPITLMAALDATLGEEWKTWEPETIRESVVSETGVELSDSNMNKVMAMKIAMVRPDRVYGDWHVLEKVAVALDGDQPAMTEIEDVSPETLSHALAVMKKMAKGKVSNQVQKYAAARLYEAGYVLAPPTLAFADTSLKGLVGDDGLRAKVANGYKQALGGQVPEADSENPVDIQVLRMMANHQYVLDKMDEAAGQIG